MRPAASGSRSGSRSGGPDTTIAGSSTSGTPLPIVGDQAIAVSRIAIPSTVTAGVAEPLPGRSTAPPSSRWNSRCWSRGRKLSASSALGIAWS